MSVWVIESNGEPFRDIVGYDSSARERTYMYDTEKHANRQLTRLKNAHRDRDKRKRALNLVVTEYMRTDNE